jgi:hypothetical protein
LSDTGEEVIGPEKFAHAIGAAHLLERDLICADLVIRLNIGLALIRMSAGRAGEAVNNIEGWHWNILRSSRKAPAVKLGGSLIVVDFRVDPP